MKRWMKIAAVSAVGLVGLGYGIVHHLRGPSGGSVAYGGSIAASVVPEFSSSDPSRWANGSPAMLATMRGSPVIIEAWSPT